MEPKRVVVEITNFFHLELSFLCFKKTERDIGGTFYLFLYFSGKKNAILNFPELIYAIN